MKMRSASRWYLVPRQVRLVEAGLGGADDDHPAVRVTLQALDQAEDEKEDGKLNEIVLLAVDPTWKRCLCARR